MPSCAPFIRRRHLHLSLLPPSDLPRTIPLPWRKLARSTVLLSSPRHDPRDERACLRTITATTQEGPARTAFEPGDSTFQRTGQNSSRTMTRMSRHRGCCRPSSSAPRTRLRYRRRPRTHRRQLLNDPDERISNPGRDFLSEFSKDFIYYSSDIHGLFLLDFLSEHLVAI
ncbi:hypothetical protein ARMGADRAFT_200329 [Armillaria gallica]|uniref:Uncharacterized protein n=1 Tax=Armillaria gallica TaxID=47427 RepID=A0A2H3DIU7_ARMGA|nr:hypothetical protein ARMGADRAFT_200329 [Armillaria gallica]